MPEEHTYKVLFLLKSSLSMLTSVGRGCGIRPGMVERGLIAQKSTAARSC